MKTFAGRQQFLGRKQSNFAVGDDSLLEVLQRAEEHFHDSPEGTMKDFLYQFMLLYCSHWILDAKTSPKSIDIAPTATC